jgi:hypothetical protein
MEVVQRWRRVKDEVWENIFAKGTCKFGQLLMPFFLSEGMAQAQRVVVEYKSEESNTGQKMW